jgi:hypothetical protein
MPCNDYEFFFPKYGSRYWSSEHQSLLRSHGAGPWKQRPQNDWSHGMFASSNPAWQPIVWHQPAQSSRGNLHSGNPRVSPSAERELWQKPRWRLMPVVGCVLLFTPLAFFGIALLVVHACAKRAERSK